LGVTGAVKYFVCVCMFEREKRTHRGSERDQTAREREREKEREGETKGWKSLVL